MKMLLHTNFFFFFLGTVHQKILCGTNNYFMALLQAPLLEPLFLSL